MISHRRNDIISAKEKQATLKAAFVFLALLTSKQTAKQSIKRCRRELASVYGTLRKVHIEHGTGKSTGNL